MRSKTLKLAAVALAVTVAVAALPLLAEGPRRGPGSTAEDGPGGRRLAKLALYLDLDDGQKAQAEQIFAAARAQAEPIRAANRDLAAQLRAALAADPPDPTAVGNLAVSIHQNRDRLRAIREAAQADFRVILTADQLLRLDALRDARRIFGRHHRGAGGPDSAGGDEADAGEPGVI